MNIKWNEASTRRGAVGLVIFIIGLGLIINGADSRAIETLLLLGAGVAMGISSNRAYNVTTANTRSFLNIASTNVHARMKIATLAGGGTWLILRRLDDNNYLRIGFPSATPTQVTIQTIEAGSIVVNKTFFNHFDYSVANDLHVKLNGPEIIIGMNNCDTYVDSIDKFVGNLSFGFQMAGTAGYIDEFMVIPL